LSLVRAVLAILFPLSGTMNKNLSGPTAKQLAHIAETKRALFRRRRSIFLPDAILKTLASLKLPPDPRIYTEHLQKLLRAKGRC
jgi:hypothetical protein